jgi:hypothetical protein
MKKISTWYGITVIYGMVLFLCWTILNIEETKSRVYEPKTYEPNLIVDYSKVPDNFKISEPDYATTDKDLSIRWNFYLKEKELAYIENDTTTLTILKGNTLGDAFKILTGVKIDKVVNEDGTVIWKDKTK